MNRIHRKFCLCALLLLIGLGAIGSLYYYRSFIQEEIPEQLSEYMEIDSEEDFISFAANVRDGNTYNGTYILLTSDLHFTEDLQPGMVGDLENENHRFEGILNGNGHTISGISIETESYASLFYYLSGTICNLNLKDCSFTGSCSGAYTSRSNSSAHVLNCSFEGALTGDTADGISGDGVGVVRNCYVDVKDRPDLKLSASLEELNTHIYGLGTTDGIREWNLWQKTGDGFTVTDQPVVTLEDASAAFNIGSLPVTIRAYYSWLDHTWCMALPPSLEKESFDITFTYTDGTQNVLHWTYDEGSSSDPSLDFSIQDVPFKLKLLYSTRIPSMFIETSLDDALPLIHANKEWTVPTNCLLLSEDGHILDKGIVERFRGHGNDSWSAQKRSYNLTFLEEHNLLDMGLARTYVLLAGYRDNSLMAYKITNDMAKEVGVEYAPETRFIHLYVDGNYLGMYLLTEKIEIGRNRFPLVDLERTTQNMNTMMLEDYPVQNWVSDNSHEERTWHELARTPEDVTGGYILEMDKLDYDPTQSRFVSKRHVSMVLKSMPYASKAQVDYIAGFWQGFETGLFAEDGYNEEGKYYLDYIDLRSFVDQWIFYELNSENSVSSSVYFYKDADSHGDGKLHAIYLWDAEHSLAHVNLASSSWIDWTGKSLDRFWGKYALHKDFKAAVYENWMERYVPAIEKTLREESIEDPNGVSTLTWYNDTYADDGALNKSRWDDCDFTEKVERIRSIYTIRKDFLSRSLSLYDTDCAYFYQKGEKFYGVDANGEKTRLDE